MKKPTRTLALAGLALATGLALAQGPAAPKPLDPRTAALISGMSPEQRIAQQVFTYVPTDVEGARALVKLGIGGVFVNRGHGPALESYKRFTSAVLSAADPAWPPLVAVDQEGGNVARIEDPALEVFPTNAVIGARSPAAALQTARHQGATFGKALRAVGITVDFAPVTDVVTNASSTIIANLGRSYSARGDTVSSLAREFSAALQAAGVAATLKHFPGHGMVTADSHETLPVATLSKAQLDRDHLRPYRDAFKDKRLRQDRMLVMTSHVLYQALDPVNPASLSRKITTDLLRGELGYQGVVITDALAMKALTGTMPERALRALRAGADFVLIDPGMENQVQETIKLAVQSYGTDKASWDENARSIERILALKRGLGLIR